MPIRDLDEGIVTHQPQKRFRTYFSFDGGKTKLCVDHTREAMSTSLEDLRKLNVHIPRFHPDGSFGGASAVDVNFEGPGQNTVVFVCALSKQELGRRIGVADDLDELPGYRDGTDELRREQERYM